MPHIHVEFVQGESHTMPVYAAESLTKRLNAFLATIDEPQVRRVETHHFDEGGYTQFFAFIWLREEEEEEED